MTSDLDTPTAAAPPPGLVVTGLSAAHGTKQVLQDIDLRVGDRQLACVLGPSGCGKTTLLRAVAGFHRPAAGRITLGGRVLDDGRRHTPVEKRRIGYIPQDVALFPHLSAAANIGFGLPRRRRQAKVSELLELVDLEAYGGRHPHELSGGQQQRVALARALATDPDLLLLDEPFSALDTSLRDRVRTDVAELLRRAGMAAVLVTHDAAEAMAFGEVITVMAEGSILQTGSPQTLFSAPTTAGVAQALGEANIVAATVDGDRAVTPFGTLPVVAAGSPAATAVLIRPHQIVLVPAQAGGVRAVVGTIEFRGGHQRIDLVLEGHDAVFAAYSDTPVAPGDAVHLEVRGPVHPLD